MTAPSFSILHFNDVYEISESSAEPVGGAARFQGLVKQLQEQYDPIILFSGDAFSPSVTSSITGGSHMPKILNKIGVHSATLGNHEFDFGIPALIELLKDCDSAPWMMANVKDKDGNFLVNSISHKLVEWHGIKLGLIGLVEKEWMETVTCFPPGVTYIDQAEEGRRLGDILRSEGAQLLIGVTHSRLPNDIYLANNFPDLDLILGGHDHDYYLEFVNKIPILNSGCNFKQATLLKVYLEDSEVEQVQQQEPVDQHATSWTFVGRRARYELQRFDVTSQFPRDPEMEQLVNEIEASLAKHNALVLGQTTTVWDAAASTVRTSESAIGNLLTDLIRNLYSTDVVLIGGGSIRSNDKYGPGPIRVGDIMKIFPFLNPVVVFELEGRYLLETIESCLSKYPAQEGRFPQVSGLWIEWNPNGAPLNRVLSVHTGDKDNKVPLDLDKVYKVGSVEYLMKGGDGCTGFTKHGRVIIEEENGLNFSTIMRNAFLQRRVLHAFDGQTRVKKTVTNALAAFAGKKKEEGEAAEGWCIDVATEGRTTPIPQ